jgi:hypothetical protein
MKKRPILLLEVLIAIALITLSILPLIYPHLAILKKETESVELIQLNHLVNQKTVEILEELYLNKIPFDTLLNEEKIPIQTDLPYKGYYQFKQKKHKPKQMGPYVIYLFDLKFSFTKDKKERTYMTGFFLIRDVPGLPTIDEESMQ